MEEVGERVGKNNPQYQANTMEVPPLGTLVLMNGNGTCHYSNTNPNPNPKPFLGKTVLLLTSAGISGSLFGMGRGNEYTCAWGGCVHGEGVCMGRGCASGGGVHGEGVCEGLKSVRASTHSIWGCKHMNTRAIW